MGLLKDWHEDNKDYRFKTRVVSLFSPKVWLRLHKWRKQRADRGWSDRDTWGAGDHIAQLTAEMLQHLNDHSYTDWPEWFKFNVQEEGRGAYKNLQSVIDDINNYLNISLDSWADGLENISTIKDGKLRVGWVDKNGKVLNDQAITALINKHSALEQKLYKKANKAMGFFGRHFAGFWD